MALKGAFHNVAMKRKNNIVNYAINYIRAQWTCGPVDLRFTYKFSVCSMSQSHPSSTVVKMH